MRQKELEIERLQQQLDRKKSSGSSDSSVDVVDGVELDEDPSAAYATEVSRHRHSDWHPMVSSLHGGLLLGEFFPAFFVGTCDGMPNMRTIMTCIYPYKFRSQSA